MECTLKGCKKNKEGKCTDPEILEAYGGKRDNIDQCLYIEIKEGHTRIGDKIS